MHVPLDEQEIVINICRDEDVAHIWTSDTTMMTKLDKYVQEGTYKLIRVERLEDGSVHGKWYECPKKWISFRHKTRTLTEEQKMAKAESFRKFREEARRSDSQFFNLEQ